MKKYYFNEIFKTNTNSAGSFIINQIRKFGQLKFWANILLKVNNIVELKKTKKLAAKAKVTIF